MNTIELNTYPIGLQFRRHSSKRKDLETVIDILKTYSDVSGDIVKVRYVTTHEFLGQQVTDRDVLSTTIARSI